ncbi:MAG TPA: hypothetical protein VK501_21745 [Baekduia sp.]|uniref:hypothetical protein n=1 Tax=Baekduia sp. TaxID=2600305 RepID=UPI002B8538C8|nr:hypothetical protein [Baekduia sp.]HMJ36543.1 hypothetical protein [Baekduia sp.]
MSGYDELERQLRESVRERREGAGARSGAARWWSRGGRGGRRGLLVVVAALVVGGGVATAAQLGVVAGHDDAPLSGRQVAYQAMRATAALPTCRMRPEGAGPTFADVPLNPDLGSFLPDRAGPGAMRAARRYSHGNPVIDGAARTVPLGHGERVVLFAKVGGGSLAIVDPVACRTARLAWVARARPDPTSRLRIEAEAVLRAARDTIPGVQSLDLVLETPRGGQGSGMPVAPGEPVPVGVVSGSSSGVYLGLSVPGAARVTADAGGLHRSFAVHDRVFVLRLPRHTGPVRVRQRAADGRVVHAETLRK